MLTNSFENTPGSASRPSDRGAPLRTWSRMRSMMRRAFSLSGNSSRICSARSSGCPAPSRVASCWVNCSTCVAFIGERLKSPPNALPLPPALAARTSSAILPASWSLAITSSFDATSISPSRISPALVTALYRYRAINDGCRLLVPGCRIDCLPTTWNRQPTTISGFLGHAQHFLERRGAVQGFHQTVFIHGAHAFAARLFLDLAHVAVLHDQAPDRVAHHQEFHDCGAAVITGCRERRRHGFIQFHFPLGLETAQAEFLDDFRHCLVTLRILGIQAPHQTLGENAVDGRSEQV